MIKNNYRLCGMKIDDLVHKCSDFGNIVPTSTSGCVQAVKNFNSLLCGITQASVQYKPTFEYSSLHSHRGLLKRMASKVSQLDKRVTIGGMYCLIQVRFFLFWDSRMTVDMDCLDLHIEKSCTTFEVNRREKKGSSITETCSHLTTRIRTEPSGGRMAEYTITVCFSEFVILVCKSSTSWAARIGASWHACLLERRIQHVAVRISALYAFSVPYLTKWLIDGKPVVIYTSVLLRTRLS